MRSKSEPGEVLARVFHCEQSDPNQWRHICGKSIKVLWAKSEIGFATDEIALFDEAKTNLSPSKSSVDGGGRQRGASLAGAGRGSFSRAGGQLYLCTIFFAQCCTMIKSVSKMFFLQEFNARCIYPGRPCSRWSLGGWRSGRPPCSSHPPSSLTWQSMFLNVFQCF